MAKLTLQIIEGQERGKIYADLQTPITIGREEDNQIRLNDERISRCHVKIQEDQGNLILTDLQSTNGTRVNGMPVQMKVLQIGDQILVGRCVLLYGSPEEIKQLAFGIPEVPSDSQLEDNATPPPQDNSGAEQLAGVHTLGLADADQISSSVAFPHGRPKLPVIDSLHERTQLSDLLAYVHIRLLETLSSIQQDPSISDGQESPERQSVNIPWNRWLQIIDLESEISQYLDEVSEPPEN